MKRSRLFACLAATLLSATLGACGSDEAPADTKILPTTDAGANDATTNDAATDAEKPPADAGPAVRTVETRPRFGTLDPKNLLLDGDFELSGPDALQYPWFQLAPSNIALGMRCRSGLRCARLQPGDLIAGVFMWPDGSGVTADFYAHVQGTSCDAEAAGYVTPIQDYFGAPNPTQLSPANDAPDKNGYCHYTASAPAPFDTGNTFWTLIIVAHKGATGAVTVDDAGIRAPSGSASSLHSASGPPTARAMAIIERARDAYEKRPPVPPRGARPPVLDPTGRLKPRVTH